MRTKPPQSPTGSLAHGMLPSQVQAGYMMALLSSQTPAYVSVLMTSAFPHTTSK